MIKNIEQVNRAVELLYQIRNNGYAEFTTCLDAFSVVKRFSIRLFIPKWSDGMSSDLDFTINLDSCNGNKDALKQLEIYAKEGFDNNPIVIERKARLLKEKKALLAKLQAELAE